MRSKQSSHALLFYTLGIFSAPLFVFSRLPIAHAQNRFDWQQRWDQTLKAAHKASRVVAWPARRADSSIDIPGHAAAGLHPGDRDAFSDIEKEVERSRVETKNLKRVFGR